MDIKQILLVDLGKAFVPQRWRLQLRKFLMKAGVTKEPYSSIAILFHTSIVLTLFLYMLIVYPAIKEVTGSLIVLLLSTFVLWVLLHLGVVLALFFVAYLTIDMIVYQRTRELEDVLDQYLGLVSENMKGGLSVEQAMWKSTRPEFGTLNREINLISKRVATGEEVSDALRELTLKYNSPMLRRSFNLIVEAMEGGGTLTELLDRIVANIKETKLLKEEMVAANTNYMIFISVIVLIVAPLLFSLSYQLLAIFTGLTSELGGSMGTSAISMPFKFGDLALNPRDFISFARAALATTATCSAMIVSMVSRGDIRGGLKYLPIYVLISLLMFTIMTAILTPIFAAQFVTT